MKTEILKTWFDIEKSSLCVHVKFHDDSEISSLFMMPIRTIDDSAIAVYFYNDVVRSKGLPDDELIYTSFEIKRYPIDGFSTKETPSDKVSAKKVKK